MDDRTARYYRLHAAEVAARYEAVSSPVEPLFPLAFALGARVLDVGAGSGRDLARLLSLGYDAYGVEPSGALIAAAIARHPELQDRLTEAALPALGELAGQPFDGILCSAVLMHLPEADLFDAAFELRRLLSPHGRLLMSIPSERDDLGPDRRDAQGRLFTDHSPGQVRLLFERLGLQQIGRWEGADALGRGGVRWTTLLFERQIGGPLRAIDQIEGILNRDRKVATYKFALFRALAELALQEPHVANWRAGDRVGVPLARIAERWLMYYWPIFASPALVPQSQSEGAGDRNPVSFRAPLQRLMQRFVGQGKHGGLTAFQFAWLADRLDPETQALLREALRSIAQAIRYGPVTYAGGALDTGRVFTCEGGAVVMTGDLWRELSLLGHWILDAVVVRWAQLTERFAHRQGLDAGDVLPLLLARPTAERATRLAREVFVAQGLQRCVWSDRVLGGQAFAVDHVIPFALWGSNDLWNLVPAHPTVNNQKSDKLPATDLLRERRTAIVVAWKALRDAHPTVFDRQMTHLLGHKRRGTARWQDELFSRLREQVEVTALQRGIERWRPKA